MPDYMVKIKKRSRKERKKLEVSAPARDDIRTRPIYEILKKEKRL